MSAEPSVLHLPASRPAALLRPGMLALLLFSVGHFFIDMYSGAIGAFQPLLVDKLGLTLTQAGLLGVVMVVPFVGAGRSPHMLIRPGETEVGLDDVVGIDGIKAEVVRSVNLFLSHQTFRDSIEFNKNLLPTTKNSQAKAQAPMNCVG